MLLNFKKKKIFLPIIFILAVIIAFFWYFYNLTSLDNKRIIRFRIVPNEGVKKIAGILSRKKIIRSVLAFKIYAVLSGNFSKIKPGIYSISSSDNITQIFKILTAKPKNIIIKIIPGETLADLDNDLFNNSLILKRGELMNFNFKKSSILKKKYPFIVPLDNLEGFVYPDNYSFQNGLTVEQIIDKILGNFNNKVISKFGTNNLYKHLIIASILEKEVNKFKDKQLVAGIILKRIKLGIPLGIDSTLIYWKCHKKFYTCSRDNLKLSKKDFKENNPYNSYLNKGLPPTPICNPSKDSIEAAYQPKSSPYFYYLTSSSKVFYSRKLSEHNYKRYLYLK